MRKSQPAAWIAIALACAGLCCPPAARAAAREEALALYADAKRPPAGDALLGKMREDPKAWGPVLLALSAEPARDARLGIDIARAFVYAGQTRPQVEAAARLLGQAPFAALDRSEWLYLCQKVAQRQVDAMPCARRLLDEGSFFITLLGGFDGVGKDYALAFLLFQMPEQSWNREIGDRLWRGGDNLSSQIAMLTALFYAVSLRDDAILARYADDATRPATARARANSLLTQMSAMERNATPDQLRALRSSMGISSALSEEELRAARRKALSQVSRDALLELERYTFLIRAAAVPRWKERLRKLD